MSRYYVMMSSEDGTGIEQLSVPFPDLEGAINYRNISKHTYKGRKLYIMKEIDE